MKHLRRQPGPLAETVRGAASVLIVCWGNIIRSPFAAHLVRQAVSRTGAVSVMSAGLEAEAGKPAHAVALEMASARQIDLRSHTASPLTAELVAQSDVIFVMDVAQLVSLRRRFPDAAARTFLLSCLAPAVPLEVADPVDGDAACFHTCFDHISGAVRPIVRLLSDPARSRGRAPRSENA
jgi:protein-tyrosine-phosphatase